MICAIMLIWGVLKLSQCLAQRADKISGAWVAIF